MLNIRANRSEQTVPTLELTTLEETVSSVFTLFVSSAAFFERDNALMHGSTMFGQILLDLYHKNTDTQFLARGTQ